LTTRRSAAANTWTAPSANSASGIEETSTNIDADGGSSSVFNSAFCAAGINASASSMITTRRRPSKGR
jgi:hypothetical protein